MIEGNNSLINGNKIPEVRFEQNNESHETRTVAGSTPTHASTYSVSFDSTTPTSKTSIGNLNKNFEEDENIEDKLAESSGPSGEEEVVEGTDKRKKRQIFLSKLVYIGLTSLVVLLLNADQNLLAPSLTVVANEFNLTEKEKDLYLGGYLSIAFFLFGGIAAILSGYAADISNRRLAFTLVVLIGAISCLCTVFVTDFWGLFVTRLFTGISTGGAGPILYSLLGDIFVDEWRGRAASSLVIMSGGGVIVGQLIASTVAPTHGWRAPFIAVSVPAIIFALLFFLVAKEPKRGGAERVLQKLVEESEIDRAELDTYSEKMTWKKFLALFRSKTVVYLLLLSLPNSLPWGFLIVYAQDFLMHDVGPTLPGGISASESLLVVMIFAISSAIGTIAGGLITDHLWKKNLIMVPIWSAVSTAIGAVPMFVMVNSRISYVGYCLLVAPSGFLVSIGGVAKTAMLLNCTLPETRGTAFAMNTLLDDLGKGVGSFLIAMLVLGMGRVNAFNFAFGGWILTAFLFALSATTVKMDVYRKNERLIEAVKGNANDNPAPQNLAGSEARVRPDVDRDGTVSGQEMEVV
jgi:MFS family permease